MEYLFCREHGGAWSCDHHGDGGVDKYQTDVVQLEPVETVLDEGSTVEFTAKSIDCEEIMDGPPTNPISVLDCSVEI